MTKKLLLPLAGLFLVLGMTLPADAGESPTSVGRRQTTFGNPQSAWRSVDLRAPLPGSPAGHPVSGEQYFCDNLFYYDDTATSLYVFSLPDYWDLDANYFNTRFTVEANHECTLKVGWVLLCGPYMTGAPDMRVYLWDDDGSGFPGNKLDSVDIPHADLPTTENGWVGADWSAGNWVFHDGEEYHIGFATIGGEGDSLFCVSDKGTGPHAGEFRSSVYLGGEYNCFVEMANLLFPPEDVVFFMESERCCYDTTARITDTIPVRAFWRFVEGPDEPEAGQPPDEVLTFGGDMVVERTEPHLNPETGKLEVETEIVEMDLTGNSDPFGPINLRLPDDLPPSTGLVAQTGTDEFFPAESFFDVFVEVELPDSGISLIPATITDAPHMEATRPIHSLPPINSWHVDSNYLPVVDRSEPGTVFGWIQALLFMQPLYPTVKIEKTEGAPLGSYADVLITTEGSDFEMSGFDFLVAYDASALTGVEVTPGQLLEDCDWQHFAYAFGVSGNCGDDCPSGLLHIVATAETAEGLSYPSCYGPPDTDPHELARMRFRVTDDNSYAGQSVPIQFFWDVCGDNVIDLVSSENGVIRFELTSRRIYDGLLNGPVLIWDEEDDDQFPEESRIPFVGDPDSCLDWDPSDPDALQPMRLLDLEFGGISILDADVPGVANIEFEQLDFLDQDGVVKVPNSDWGQVSFDINPVHDGSVWYLNVTGVIGADTGWIVRNYPVLPSQFIDSGRFALHLDLKELGVSSETDVPSLAFVHEVLLALQTSGPLGIFATAPVADLDIRRFGSIIPTGDNEYDGPSPLSPMYITEEVDTDSLRKYRGMPSVQEGNSECAPGSTARSLKWLSDKHNLELGSVEDIQDSLAKPEYMNQGVSDSAQLVAKKKFIEDNNLDLEVHFWHSEYVYPNGISIPGVQSESADDIDLIKYLWRELGRGQDIEITISWGTGGGHSVTLVGIDKKNKTIEYRDDESQGDDEKGDKSIKDTKLVPLGSCIVNSTSYATTEGYCDSAGGEWKGYDGEYGFDAMNDWIKTAMCESPKRPEPRWSYHPRLVDGWLTVYGTIDCYTVGPPLAERVKVVVCNKYSGQIPFWYNDYLTVFEWDSWCENVDFNKVAVPYYYNGQWRLYPLADWMTEHLAEEVQMPTIGDSTGEFQNVHIVVDLEEWLVNPQPLQEEYTIINGECPDLPGYLIGTTPIVFDPEAPPPGAKRSGANVATAGPFSTTPLTGTLSLNGDLTFSPGEASCCIGITGNVDNDPEELIDLGDLTALIDYLFISFTPPVCIEEANVDGDPAGQIDLGDLTALIDYLFITFTPPAPCL